MEREKRRDLPKLVRDKIPALKQKAGENPVFHIASEKEFYKGITEKLVEEATELSNAKTREEFIEEAADVLEVMEALMNLSWERQRITWREIENKRSAKAVQKGKFVKKYILDSSSQS